MSLCPKCGNSLATGWCRYCCEFRPEPTMQHPSVRYTQTHHVSIESIDETKKLNKRQLFRKLKKMDSLCGDLSVGGYPHTAYEIRLLIEKLKREVSAEEAKQ